MKRSQLVCLYQGQILSSKSGSSVTYQIEYLSQRKKLNLMFEFLLKRALTYSGFMLIEGQECLPCVLTHLKTMWPSLELCILEMRIVPLRKRVKIAVEPDQKWLVDRISILVFSNWNKITLPFQTIYTIVIFTQVIAGLCLNTWGNLPIRY